MNIRWLMKWMWVLANARQTLIDAWVSAEDLQWVDFSNMNSLSKLAQKIWPTLLKRNPQIAKQIKESDWLQWKEKQDVVEVIDSI